VPIETAYNQWTQFEEFPRFMEGVEEVEQLVSVSPGVLNVVRGRLRELGVEFQGPVEHPGGDRSLYCEDPAGNVLELWDFFQRREGIDGVDALASSGG
jgi:hypothetical protein